MRGIATNFLHRLRGWRADRRGAVTAIVALMLLVFLGMCGLAVDFAMAFNARSKAESAADAAGLRALETVRSAVMANQGDFESIQAQAEADGRSAFQAQLGTIPMGRLSSSNVVVARDPRTGVVTATVKYSGYVTTSFMKLFGIPRQGFANTVQTSTTLPKYVHLTLLVDTSQSMGIGADTSAISSLFNDQNVQCGFACHDSGTMRTEGANWQLPGGQMTDNYWLYQRCGSAHGGAALPVPMRVDFVRQAISTILTSLQASSELFTASALIFGTPDYPTVLPSTLQRETCPDHSVVKFYGYSSSPPTRTQLAGSSLSSVLAMVPYIDNEDNTQVVKSFGIPLGYPNRDTVPGSYAIGYTQTTSVLQWLADNLPSSGTGITPQDPIQVVLLLTDGTESDPQNFVSNAHVDTLPSTLACQALTIGKNATLLVVDTTYPDLSGYPNSAYDKEVAPIASQISSNLQSCASPGYYAQATNGAQIQSAASALVTKFQQSLAIAISR